MSTRLLMVVSVGTLLSLAACSPPIGVSRVGARAVQQSLTASALSTGRASEWTRNTVNGWGLLDRFDDGPEGALAALREIVTSGRGGSQELFALGELSFLHAEDAGKKPYYLAAAVYTWAFLFPGKGQELQGTLEVYTASDAEEVVVEGRPVPLEIEETATLASQLADSPIWKRELWGVPRPRPDGRQAAHAGEHDALRAWTDPGRLRPRHRVEPGTLGRHGELLGQRPAAPTRAPPGQPRPHVARHADPGHECLPCRANDGETSHGRGEHDPGQPVPRRASTGRPATSCCRSISAWDACSRSAGRA